MTTTSKKRKANRKQTPIMVYACRECKSVNVQIQKWVDPNYESIEDDTERYSYCYACENDGNDGTLQYFGLIQINIDDARDEPEREELRKFLLAKVGRSN